MEGITLKNTEKTLFQVVSEGNAAELKIFLDQFTTVPEDRIDVIGGLNILVNCKDESGFSPLQIAARLGYSEICDLLINCGADIDISSENCPSPLMLAASNNHYDVVKMLLDRNAIISSSCPDPTETDEAALKVHTEINDLINICMITRALDFYFKTAKDGDSDLLGDFMYDLLINDNKHPVRLIMDLRKNTAMVSKVAEALRGMRNQQYQFFNNEKFSWMCHGMSYFVSHAAFGFNNTMFDENIFDGLIEKLLHHQPKNGYSRCLLRHMQAAIYVYPFTDSKMYKSMKSAKLAEFSNEHLSFSRCETCRNLHGIQLCKGCKNVMYCNSECQLLHWPVHRNECNGSPII